MIAPLPSLSLQHKQNEREKVVGEKVFTQAYKERERIEEGRFKWRTD